MKCGWMIQFNFQTFHKASVYVTISVAVYRPLLIFIHLVFTPLIINSDKNVNCELYFTYCSFFIKVTHIKRQICIWIYVKIAQFALVLLSRDFNPEKYHTLCKVFSRQYKKTGSAADILESYLSVATRGTCNSDENGKFSINDYNKQQAYTRTCIKGAVYTKFVFNCILVSK